MWNPLNKVIVMNRRTTVLFLLLFLIENILELAYTITSSLNLGKPISIFSVGIHLFFTIFWFCILYRYSNWFVSYLVAVLAMLSEIPLRAYQVYFFHFFINSAFDWEMQRAVYTQLGIAAGILLTATAAIVVFIFGYRQDISFRKLYPEHYEAAEKPRS